MEDNGSLVLIGAILAAVVGAVFGFVEKQFSVMFASIALALLAVAHL